MKGCEGVVRSEKKGALEKELFLSVVVIGRNEETRLPALFASLPAGEDVEWIYVDSQSDDNSLNVALASGAKAFLVATGSVCGPATGRFIGTLEARGRWILYLDGDMVLAPGFLPLLQKLREQGDSASSLPGGTAGFVGRTTNRYLDAAGRISTARDAYILADREAGKLDYWGNPASYHGGAVLYARRWVLLAGNWNPAVCPLEEIDLYSRVRAAGGTVRALDLPMVDHYTAHMGLGQKLKMNFFPRCGGKDLHGAGQVVAARCREGSLLSFIRYYPYPFMVLAGLLFAFPAYLLWPPLPLVFNLAIATWLGRTRKWYYYLVYLGNVVQMIRGVGRYRPFKPDYSRIG